jgi:hypothetical protein
MSLSRLAGSAIIAGVRPQGDLVGRLDLDDPAVAWLPELRQAASPFRPIETVTIRRMLPLRVRVPSDHEEERVGVNGFLASPQAIGQHQVLQPSVAPAPAISVPRRICTFVGVEVRVVGSLDLDVAVVSAVP